MLTINTLPDFDRIKIDEIKNTVSDLIASNKKEIDALINDNPKSAINWHSFVKKMESIGDVLDRYWSPISHMNGVVNSPELRDAYNACLPLLSEYGTELGQHQGFYQAVQNLYDKKDDLDLDAVQIKILEDNLRDFKLSGVSLDDDKKERYGDIQIQLSELSSKFEQNLLDSTMAWHKDIEDVSLLSGLPDSALAAAKQTAEAKGVNGYRLTLEYPSYLPVMMHADNQDLRKEVYTAFCTRASDQGPHDLKFDNSDLMPKIVDLKQQLAQLLDFNNYAELSLVTKMASSPQAVLDFLNELADKSASQAQKEFSELTDFAEKIDGNTKLKAWDLAYYSEKLKQHKYSISQEELRPWFPEHHVVNGMFEICKRLFDIDIKSRSGVSVWHKDVSFYDVFDSNQQHIASFYLDLYARENKRGGAWMADCIGRREVNGSIQKPVAFLTCNFNGPVGDTPALFTHDEVTTLFHEFGHGLHHMLTKIEHASVAGINGVAWDAVELPSQFMENFCWAEDGLEYIAKHYETGESLPKDKLDKLLAAKNFQSAMQMLRQIEFALFDFHIHTHFDSNKKDFIQNSLNAIREKVSVVPVPEFNRFQHGFSHIFAGGYAAGYYSYKWAEVLSADAFSKFEEEGIFNPATGQSFLQHILEKGGSEDAADLFKAFRGREPSIEPLLKHSGITY